MKTKISIGADHAGFALKEEVKRYLSEQGYDVIDHGTNSDKRVDYPDFAHLVAESIHQGEVERGIIVCGTGIGVAIAANKINRIRAASLVDEYSVKMARNHNDLNVLCLGARVIGSGKAMSLVDVFLKEEFEGGRHADRVKKIHNLENGNHF